MFVVTAVRGVLTAAGSFCDNLMSAREVLRMDCTKFSQGACYFFFDVCAADLFFPRGSLSVLLF